MPTEIGERVLPHNQEAEKALLGSILLDDGALNVVLETLVRDDFYSESHRLIFEKMLALFEKSHAIDLVTLSEELSKEGLLERVGGASYLASLTDGIPIGTTASVAGYSRIVKEKSILRQIINASSNVVARALQGVEDPVALLDEAQSRILEIATEKVQSGFSRVQDIVRTSFGTLDVLFDHGQSVTGIETGFTALDNMTSGLQPGELVIIAARPSLGKTALALNIAAHAAITGKRVVGIFSLEMSKESLLIRMLCSEGEIDSHRLRTGFADQADWDKMTQALGRLSQAPLFIDDTPALSIMQIRAKARRLHSERKKLDLIIVDYLQLVTGHGRFENRTQEVSYISRGLKAIAKELSVPVIALSQLSRAPEAGKGREPQLSDLRESGSIEQDADVVIFIHRASRSGDGTGLDEPGIVTELNIGKQRNGPTGPFKLVFLKPYTRFANLAPHEEEM
jgi:replicative DNA helicase